MPEGLQLARLVVIGAGKTASSEQKDLLKLGGLAMGKLPLAASEVTIFAELAQWRVDGRTNRRPRARRDAARLCFDRYKTKRKEDEKRPASAT